MKSTEKQVYGMALVTPSRISILGPAVKQQWEARLSNGIVLMMMPAPERCILTDTKVPASSPLNVHYPQRNDPDLHVERGRSLSGSIRFVFKGRLVNEWVNKACAAGDNLHRIEDAVHPLLVYMTKNFKIFY